MIIIIVSGFFDSIGVQHLSLFEEAKKLGDYLIVGVNSDKCSQIKKGQPSFMPVQDRKKIIESIKYVDEVVEFNDDDGSACQLIMDIYNKYKETVNNGKDILYFANGGDRIAGINTPEEKYVEENLKGKVIMKYEVGGSEKIASSSDYLRNWVNNTMIRYKIDFQVNNKY
jgi:cytidyltransferase-like protein